MTTTTTIGDRFGEVLNRLKQDRKIKNQGTIAVSTGYTVATLSEIKSGRMNLPDKIIEYLAEEHGVNPDYLIRGEGDIYGRAEIKKAPEFQEPQERIYLIESVHNLTQSSKIHAQSEVINAKNIERLITLLEYQQTNLHKSASAASQPSEQFESVERLVSKDAVDRAFPYRKKGRG